MTPTEACDVIDAVQEACPHQHIGDHTRKIAFVALQDFGAQECLTAVGWLAGRQPFIAIAEIADRVRTVHAERLSASPVPAPPEPYRDDPRLYLVYLRTAQHLIMQGKTAEVAALGGCQAADQLAGQGERRALGAGR